jgi:microcystin degradation protein MlrC
MKRVLVAQFAHESHTFIPGYTQLKDFEIIEGDAFWALESGVTLLAGVIERACYYDWQLVVAPCMVAVPGPIVADEVVEYFWLGLRAVVEREADAGFDGIYLDLHGAMVSESLVDVEGEMLRRLRALPLLAEVPLAGTLDLHGNITPLMAQHSDALIAYRQNPHTDSQAMARFACDLLERMMITGERARTIYATPPLILPPTATGTAADPMRALEAQARSIEAAIPEIVGVNVFAGYSFADVPQAGVSFTVVTFGSVDVAQAHLDKLCETAWQLRDAGLQTMVTLDEAMLILRRHSSGRPLLLVEPSDNIGGGAPGDNTTVLRALLDHNIQNAAVCICDADAISQLRALPPGGEMTLDIGGKSGIIGAQSLRVTIEMIRRTDGRFTIEDRQSHGAGQGERVEMGDCALVRCAGVTLLLTSRPTPPFDLAQWRSQGVDPETFFAINVKAALAHRQAYNPIAGDSLMLDIAGPCSENLKMLPYVRLRRPIYPLDPAQDCR